MTTMLRRCNIQAGYAFTSHIYHVVTPKWFFMNPITLYSILVFFILTFLSSCEPKDEDGIPSYIHIERIGLTTIDGQGTASHKITDAWVYIDDKLIGAFELPATFPVLKEGEHELTVYAGIKINGIAATRAPYPFYSPIITNVTLTPGAVTSITDTIVFYDENITFLWMEDFNDASVSIDTTSSSETHFHRTSDPELVFKFRDEPNTYSATALLSGDTLLFECATINSFDLPRSGTPVFLEMNYKNNHNLTVGVFFAVGAEVHQQSVLVLNPTETWNKIYINLTPIIASFSGSTSFRIFTGLLRSPDSEAATIYFDHFKLIY